MRRNRYLPVHALTRAAAVGCCASVLGSDDDDSAPAAPPASPLDQVAAELVNHPALYGLNTPAKVRAWLLAQVSCWAGLPNHEALAARLGEALRNVAYDGVTVSPLPNVAGGNRQFDLSPRQTFTDTDGRFVETNYSQAGRHIDAVFVPRGFRAAVRAKVVGATHVGFGHTIDGRAEAAVGWVGGVAHQRDGRRNNCGGLYNDDRGRRIYYVGLMVEDHRSDDQRQAQSAADAMKAVSYTTDTVDPEKVEEASKLTEQIDDYRKERAQREGEAAAHERYAFEQQFQALQQQGPGAGAFAPGAGGMPAWLLPVGVGAGALTLLAIVVSVARR